MPDKLHRQWDIYMDRDLDKDTHVAMRDWKLCERIPRICDFVQDIDGWEGIVKFNGKKALGRGHVSAKEQRSPWGNMASWEGMGGKMKSEGKVITSG